MGRDAAHAHVLLDLAKTRKWNEADPTLKKMVSVVVLFGNMCRKFHWFWGPYVFLGPQTEFGVHENKFSFFSQFFQSNFEIWSPQCVFYVFFFGHCQ